MVTLVQPSSPSDYSSKKLDALHRDNFKQMLRCMQLNAGGNVTGGPQSTLNIVPGTPNIVGRTVEGLEEEAKPFEPIAYGATLGLVYYRAIGPQARLQWDIAMTREIREGLNAHREAMEVRRKLGMQLAMDVSVSHNADWLKTRDINAITIQNFARYTDFMLTLQQKKSSVFPSANEEALSKPDIIGINPWCLGTKPEFLDAYKQVLGNPGTSKPSFFTGAPGERETLMQNASKMFGKAVEAKVIEYLSLFLEKASEMLLKGALREGMNYICKYPLVDLLVDWLKDRMAAQELADLRAAYTMDMTRRISLYHKGWGINPAPELDEVTPADRKAAGAQAMSK